MTSGSRLKLVSRRWTPPLAVVALLAAVWAAAALSSPELNNLPVPPLRDATQTPTFEPIRDTVQTASVSSEQTEVETPDEMSGLVAIVALVVIVTVGGLVTWAFVRRRAASGQGTQLVVQRRAAPRRRASAEEVVDAIDAGLTELSDADADPRRAVIACWVRLERAAVAAGTPHFSSDSSTDLVARLLRERAVDPAALEGLASVYREARFATHHPVTERTRRAARDALRRVRADLGQRVEDLDAASAPGSGVFPRADAAPRGGDR